ncbi:ACT domain-containing protein [Patulibacter sp. NPDC049589]|uniref:ACT domain-containing protein n=1 Tax=Patulibacter sp. NPDC049589 TaxID=3154731 RepID=UPI0034262929
MSDPAAPSTDDAAATTAGGPSPTSDGVPADPAPVDGSGRALLLDVLAVHLQVCRLNHDAPIPAWLPRTSSPLTAIVRTADELSIVCPAAEVPTDVRHEGPWRALRVAGPLDFALVGILTRLTAPLAVAGIPIFALSTFDTDYVLVRAHDLDAAVVALRDAGHGVRA